jgi:hypothetical protein
MSFSTTIDQAILDHFYGLASWTAPTNTWAGYSTTTPTKAGTNVTEPNSGTTGYGRVEVTAWTRASSEVDNDAVIEFPEATGDQGTITHAVLYDAETEGNMLWFGALTAPKAVTTGDTPRFPAGDFNITQS